MARPRLTLLVFIASLGVTLPAAASQAAPTRASYRPGPRPVYRLALLEVEPLTPDRLQVLPAENPNCGSLSSLAADGRHSTGLELVYSLNHENGGVSRNRRLLSVSGASLAADPRHSSGSELAMRLNADNDGLGEPVASGRSGHHAALFGSTLAWCAEVHLALGNLGGHRRPAAYLSSWSGCGAQAAGAIGLDRVVDEAAATAIARALRPARAAATAVTRRWAALVRGLARGLAEAATTLSAAGRAAVGAEWAAGGGGWSNGSGREL